MSNLIDEMRAKELFGVQADGKDMSLYASALSALPNPDEVLKKLGLNISAYYELDTDDQVASAMQLRKDNVKSMSWELEQSQTRDDIYRFVNNVIKKWDMEKLIGEMLEAIPYGYSVMEKIWLKDVYGYYYIANVVGKPPHWFQFDTNNRVRFMSKKLGGTEGVLLSKRKFTVVQNYPTYINPYGNAIYKKCYWPVKFKRGGIKFMAKFVEKFGMVLLLGQIGRNGEMDKPATKEQTDNFVTALDGLHQDGVGAIPGTDDVLVISGNSQASSEIYKSFIELQDKQIAKAILSHSSAVDSVAGALGNRDQIVQSINIIRDSDAKLVIGNINEVISQMVQVNYGNVSELEIPVFKLIAKDDALEIKTRAEIDTILSGIGVKFTAKYIKTTYDLQDDEFTISDKPTPPPFGDYSAQDELETQMSDKFQSVMQPLVDSIAKGDSFEEIKSKLIELNKNLDTTELEALISDVLAVTSVAEEV